MGHARSLNQPHNIGFIAGATCLLRAMRREAEEIKPVAEKFLAIEGVPLSQQLPAIITRDWAIAAGGDLETGMAALERSLGMWRESGSEYLFPFFSSLLAEIYLSAGRIADADAIADEELSRIERTGQRQWTSLVLCIKGDSALAARIPDDAEAERCYREAIDIARAQSAKSWELRAAIRLAQLWHDQGKSTEARDLLAPVYGWFTEGFDTPDLMKAKALLDELS